MYNTLQEAREALEAAEQDVVADFGEEGLEAGWHDVVHNVASFCKDDVARELLRTELGEEIFPGDPDPLKKEPIEVSLRSDPNLEKRLEAARKRREAIRSELPLDGDFKWRN